MSGADHTNLLRHVPVLHWHMAHFGQDVLIVGLAILTILFTKKVFTVLRSPLRTVPGPWYAIWTDLPLRRATIAGRRMYHIHELHEKYGPYVLVDPTQVSVLDPEGFTQIHRMGTHFMKSSWYSNFNPWERPNLFTTIDRKKHADRRKLLARPFSKNVMREEWEPVIRGIVLAAITKIKAEGATSTVDLLKWFLLMSNDVSSRLMFGKAFGAVERGMHNDHMRVIAQTTRGRGMLMEFPPFVRWILRNIPMQACQELFNGSKTLRHYGIRATATAKAEGNNTLFRNLIEDAKKGEKFDDLDVLIESSGMIVAGTDTTAVSTTYLIWSVLSRPHWQKLLVDEVKGLPEDAADEDMEKAPILNAIMSESMRLYGAVPGALPRAVPSGGAHFGDHFIPEGTTVSTQAYSYHRDPELFPDPYKFDPSRFLPDSQRKASPEALAVLHPFGAGSRICIGMHQARMVMRYAVVEFFKQFPEAHLGPNTTDESMDMQSFFLISPKSRKMEVLLQTQDMIVG